MLSDCCLSVCQSVCPVLSVTLVYCGQTVGRIKMKLGKLVGLGTRHIVLWGLSSPSPKGHSPQLSPHVNCGQTVGWIKMPLGKDAGLDPGLIVLDGDPARPTEAPPHFSVHVYCGQTVAHLSNC